MKIGQVIREIRKSQQATLEDVAFAAKTTASNLSRVELGRHGCSPDMLERIAAALGASVAEIYRRAEGAGLSAQQPAPPKYGDVADVSALRYYDQLSTEYQSLADDFIRMLLRRQKRQDK